MNNDLSKFNFAKSSPDFTKSLEQNTLQIQEFIKQKTKEDINRYNSQWDSRTNLYKELAPLLYQGAEIVNYQRKFKRVVEEIDPLLEEDQNSQHLEECQNSNQNQINADKEILDQVAHEPNISTVATNRIIEALTGGDYNKRHDQLTQSVLQYKTYVQHLYQAIDGLQVPSVHNPNELVTWNNADNIADKRNVGKEIIKTYIAGLLQDGHNFTKNELRFKLVKPLLDKLNEDVEKWCIEMEALAIEQTEQKQYEWFRKQWVNNPDKQQAVLNYLKTYKVFDAKEDDDPNWASPSQSAAKDKLKTFLLKLIEDEQSDWPEIQSLLQSSFKHKGSAGERKFIELFGSEFEGEITALHAANSRKKLQDQELLDRVAESDWLKKNVPIFIDELQTVTDPKERTILYNKFWMKWHTDHPYKPVPQEILSLGTNLERLDETILQVATYQTWKSGTLDTNYFKMVTTEDGQNQLKELQNQINHILSSEVQQEYLKKFKTNVVSYLTSQGQKNISKSSESVVNAGDHLLPYFVQQVKDAMDNKKYTDINEAAATIFKNIAYDSINKPTADNPLYDDILQQGIKIPSDGVNAADVNSYLNSLTKDNSLINSRNLYLKQS